MANNFVNGCVWLAASGGTGTFTVATAVAPYFTPAQATNPPVVNGDTYNYFAVNAAQYEIGRGVYAAAGATLTRASIRSSTNAGAAVNFTAPPKVYMGGPLADDKVLATGSTTPRSLSDRSADVVNVKDFGAVGDGVADDTAAFNAAIAQMLSRWPYRMYIPAGEYLITDELDFTAAVEGVSVVGDGMRHSRIIASAFGASKKVFKFGNPDTNTRPNQCNFLADFEITGNTRNAQHPIGIYIPYSNADHLRSIRVRALGNTAFWVSGANNSRLEHCQATGCGFSYTQDNAATSGKTFSGTGGTNQVTASSSVFVAGHVGRNIHLQGAGFTGFPAAFTITAVAGTTATLDRNIPTTFSGELGTFEGVRGSISSSSATFVSEVGIFSAADVGRFIYVERAGINNGLLVTTISAYTNATTVTLANAALNTATTQFFYLTPAFFCGAITDDDADSRRTNDLRLNDCLGEENVCVDYIFRRVTNTWGRGCKTHGISNYDLAGRHVRNLIVDEATQFSWTEGEFDRGHSKSGGNILICGSQGDSVWDDLSVSSVSDGQYFWELDSSSVNTMLCIGDVLYNKNFATEPGLVRFGANATAHNVVLSGKVIPRVRANVTAFTRSLKSGSWTPVPVFQTMGDFAPTAVTASGYWRRDEDFAECWFDVTFTANAFTTASGEFRLTGLPFTSASDIAIWGGSMASYATVDMSTSGRDMAPQVLAGNAIVRFVQLGDNVGHVAVTPTQIVPSAAGVKLIGMVRYRIVEP